MTVTRRESGLLLKDFVCMAKFFKNSNSEPFGMNFRKFRNHIYDFGVYCNMLQNQAALKRATFLNSKAYQKINFFHEYCGHVLGVDRVHKNCNTWPKCFQMNKCI